MSYNRPSILPSNFQQNEEILPPPPPYSEHDTLNVPPRLPSRPLSPNVTGEEITPPLPSRPSRVSSGNYLNPPLPTRPSRNNSMNSLNSYESNSSYPHPLPPPVPSRTPSISTPSRNRFDSSRDSASNRPSIPTRNYDMNNRAQPAIPSRDTSSSPRVSSNNSTMNNFDESISNQMKHLSINNNSHNESNDYIAVDFETPLSVAAPPSNLFQYRQHPIPLPMNYCKTKEIPTLETNKFYGNMFLGEQKCPIWTHPYSLWFTKELPFIGIAATHIRDEQKVFDDKNDPPQFYFSPTNIKAFVFSANEFSNVPPESVSINFSNVKHMSIQLQLKLNDSQFVWFPIVQGMGFITAIYYNLTPSLQSAIGYRNLELVWNNGPMSKYHITLENNIVWTLYTISQEPITLSRVDGNRIIADKVVNGCIFQLVADTANEIDQAANCYQIDAKLSASVVQNDPGKANYTFEYETNGSSSSGNPLIYALPHHIDSMTPETLGTKIDSHLASTVSGMMSGFVTDKIEMEILIPSKVQFEPYTMISDKESNYSTDVLNAMRNAAIIETGGDVINESNLDSMYFSGKVLAKYAWILYCCQYILKDSTLVDNLLNNLKTALQRFIDNQQILPLVYDATWGGLISSGNESQDFGNPYYNDHHFHYSYHIIAAAIIAKVDKDVFGNSSWLDTNREWVELLIRDYANMSSADPYFPVFRSFDWFNGHSWAKGLFESGDGKDEESSSEDVNASYALKLWGLVTNNQNLVNIADVQLGILRTSLNKYFLYADDNNVEPTRFIKNRVSGILFENKIDHTTYFGNKIEYIQMIHSIPIIPPSSFIRSPVFVRQEWEQILKNIVNDVNDGWKGIIMLNVALFDPNLAYSFFAAPNFNRDYLDNGQSLTWSLAFSGAYK